MCQLHHFQFAFGESSFVSYGVAIGIGRYLGQIPLGPRLGLGTQSRNDAPSDHRGET